MNMTCLQISLFPLLEHGAFALWLYNLKGMNLCYISLPFSRARITISSITIPLQSLFIILQKFNFKGMELQYIISVPFSRARITISSMTISLTIIIHYFTGIDEFMIQIVNMSWGTEFGLPLSPICIRCLGSQPQKFWYIMSIMCFHSCSNIPRSWLS